MRKIKSLSLILAIAMMLSMVSFAFSVSAEETTTYKIGDVNLSGEIDIRDATEIQKALVDIVNLTELQTALADTDGDKNVSIKDATEIQKYISDLSTNEIIGSDYTASTQPTSSSSEESSSQSEASSQVSSSSSETTVATEPTESTGLTYYFTNNKGWNNVYLYAYTGSNKNAAWPGVKLTNIVMTNSYGQDIYEAKVESTYTTIIFSNGATTSQQTANIVLANYTTNAFYCSGTATPYDVTGYDFTLVTQPSTNPSESSSASTETEPSSDTEPTESSTQAETCRLYIADRTSEHWLKNNDALMYFIDNDTKETYTMDTNEYTINYSKWPVDSDIQNVSFVRTSNPSITGFEAEVWNTWDAGIRGNNNIYVITDDEAYWTDEMPDIYPTTETEPTYETVAANYMYYTVTNIWDWENFYVYAWNNATGYCVFDYPGLYCNPISAIGTDENGHKVYRICVDTANQDKILICDGTDENKTVDTEIDETATNMIPYFDAEGDFAVIFNNNDPMATTPTSESTVPTTPSGTNVTSEFANLYFTIQRNYTYVSGSDINESLYSSSTITDKEKWTIVENNGKYYLKNAFYNMYYSSMTDKAETFVFSALSDASPIEIYELSAGVHNIYSPTAGRYLYMFSYHGPATFQWFTMLGAPESYANKDLSITQITGTAPIGKNVTEGFTNLAFSMDYNDVHVSGRDNNGSLASTDIVTSTEKWTIVKANDKYYLKNLAYNLYYSGLPGFAETYVYSTIDEATPIEIYEVETGVYNIYSPSSDSYLYGFTYRGPASFHWYKLSGAPQSYASKNFNIVLTTAEESTVETVPVTAKTIYFTNNYNWNSVKAYVFNSTTSTEAVAWPGTAMTQIGTNEFGQKIYSITVDTTLYNSIIFTDGYNQTEDITISATENAYYIDALDTNSTYTVSAYNYIKDVTSSFTDVNFLVSSKNDKYVVPAHQITTMGSSEELVNSNKFTIASSNDNLYLYSPIWNYYYSGSDSTLSLTNSYSGNVNSIVVYDNGNGTYSLYDSTYDQYLYAVEENGVTSFQWFNATNTEAPEATNRELKISIIK